MASLGQLSWNSNSALDEEVERLGENIDKLNLEALQKHQATDSTQSKEGNNFLEKSSKIFMTEVSGCGSGQEKFVDPDSVCPEWFDPDLVNIRPDPKPWRYFLNDISALSTNSYFAFFLSFKGNGYIKETPIYIIFHKGIQGLGAENLSHLILSAPS